MYRQFFGLTQSPFKVSPDPKFFFKHAARENVLNTLIYSIARDDAILKIVGEVGVGKTTLLRLLSSKLPESYIKVYVSAPNLSASDFLRLIGTELDLGITSQATKHEVLSRLKSFLLDQHAKGRKVILLIDEAQSMTLDTLEEIRLLGNLETETDKMLQIVLCGQPELDITLNDERVRPLKSRIASQVYLVELTPEEVKHYLNYRMRVAGNLHDEVFSLDAAKRIQRLSAGLPRQINLIADKLLMAAYASEDKVIKPKHFRSLGSEGSFRGVKSKWRWMYTLIAIAAMGVALGLSMYIFPISGVWKDSQSWLSNLSRQVNTATVSLNGESVEQVSDSVTKAEDMARYVDPEEDGESSPETDNKNQIHSVQADSLDLTSSETDGKSPTETPVTHVDQSKEKESDIPLNEMHTANKNQDSFEELDYDGVKSNPSENVRKENKDSLHDKYSAAFRMMEKKQFLQARRMFEQLWQEHPHSSLADNAVYWMGEISMALNEPLEAEKWFKQVVDAYPTSSKSASALLRYGDMLRARGEILQAQRYYKRVVKGYPNRREATIAKKYLDNPTP